MKRLALFLLAAVFVTACGGAAPSPTPSEFGEDGVHIFREWVTEEMTYFTATANEMDEDAPLLLHVTDHATGNTFPLCNRPDCAHNSHRCNAYIPQEAIEDDWGGFPGIRMDSSPFVFVDGDFVYAHNRSNAIYRWRLDGTRRTQVVRIPDRYEFHAANLNDDGWLMNGKLYLRVSEVKPAPGALGISVGVFTLIEIDYVSSEVRTLWQQENRGMHDDNSSTDTVVFVGAWGGVIFIEESVLPPGGVEADFTGEWLDGIYTTLFSVNPAIYESGKAVETIRSGYSYEFTSNAGHLSNAGHPVAEVFYLSRRDGTIFHIDLVAVETTLIAEGLPEFGSSAYLGRVLDEWLNIIVTGEELASAMYYINISTGEIMSSEFRVESTINGEPRDEEGYSRILRDEDGYFYIKLAWEITETFDEDGEWESVDSRYLIGRISKDDFWANNAAAIEPLDWFSWREFLEFEFGEDFFNF